MSEFLVGLSVIYSYFNNLPKSIITHPVLEIPSILIYLLNFLWLSGIWNSLSPELDD